MNEKIREEKEETPQEKQLKSVAQRLSYLSPQHPLSRSIYFMRNIDLNPDHARGFQKMQKERLSQPYIKNVAIASSVDPSVDFGWSSLEAFDYETGTATLRSKKGEVVHLTFDYNLNEDHHSAPEQMQAWLSNPYGRIPLGMKLMAKGLPLPPEDEPFNNAGYFTNTLSISGSFTGMGAYEKCVFPPVGTIQQSAMLFRRMQKLFNYQFDPQRDSLHFSLWGHYTDLDAAIFSSSMFLSGETVPHFKSKFDYAVAQENHRRRTRGRLAIYGFASQGSFSDFPYWHRNAKGLEILNQGPVIEENFFQNSRTDWQAGQSLEHGAKGQLIGTLLTHQKYGGYWREMGAKFRDDYCRIFKKAGLSELLDEKLWTPSIEDSHIPYIYNLVPQSRQRHLSEPFTVSNVFYVKNDGPQYKTEDDFFELQKELRIQNHRVRNQVLELINRYDRRNISEAGIAKQELAERS